MPDYANDQTPHASASTIGAALGLAPLTAVTIIVPVHNHERYVRAAVKSVLEQTYNDFTLLLIDDGSTDGSLEAMRLAVGNDPRAHIVSGPNRGLTHVLADAFAHVR